MDESDFRLITFFRDFKNDVRALPFVIVFGEIETISKYMPDDFLGEDEFCDLYFAKMHVLVAVSKLGTELVGAAFDIFRPPTANIIDRFEGLFRNLVHRNGGGEIFIAHGSPAILSVARLATLVKTCGATLQAAFHHGLG